MKKFFIKNNKWQNISVIVENEHGKWELIFITHWLWDDKNSSHIIQYTKPFLTNDFVVVRFDTTNTFWESDGNFEDATLTNYYEDLKDVIEWASYQYFYKEKFILLWHSLWAISSALYSQEYSYKILSLILISSPINYELSAFTYSHNVLQKWGDSGFLIENWGDFVVKLKWGYMEDKKKYNLLKNPEKFTMPVLIISWENDHVTPYNHQKIFFDAIKSYKQIHIIKNWPHTFTSKKHFDEIKILLDEWISNLKQNERYYT